MRLLLLLVLQTVQAIAWVGIGYVLSLLLKNWVDQETTYWFTVVSLTLVSHLYGIKDALQDPILEVKRVRIEFFILWSNSIAYLFVWYYLMAKYFF